MLQNINYACVVSLLNIFFQVHFSGKFDRNPTYWKCHLKKLEQNNYIIEVEFCRSGGKLRLPEDADNKLLRGDGEWE